MPLRANVAEVLTGPMPLDSSNVWRPGHYDRPEALPVILIHVMSAKWHGAKWWRPWQYVAELGTRVVLGP